MHNHRDIVNYLTAEGLEMMSHPSYSRDLVPYNFSLNDYTKSRLGDHTNQESIAQGVYKILNNISTKEFKKTFDKLLKRMDMRINQNDDNIEHLIKFN